MVERNSAHDSKYHNKESLETGKGHSVPGKAPEMAYVTQESVDITTGFSGHHTKTGEPPVYPDFGNKIR